jgi:RNAse (barnase) inhibitor barstar
VTSRSDFVWLREALPWLGPGFVHCVHEDALDVLDRDLRRAGFAVVRLPGEDVTDAHGFHAAAKRAFAFPDYYGHNWDAFNECFGEVELAHPTAIVWTAAERLADSDLKTFAEAIAEFARFRDAFADPDPGSVDVSRPTQIELFLVGRGAAFRRPG